MATIGGSAVPVIAEKRSPKNLEKMQSQGSESLAGMFTAYCVVCNSDSGIRYGGKKWN
jgi:hypothetical protein